MVFSVGSNKGSYALSVNRHRLIRFQPFGRPFLVSKLPRSEQVVAYSVVVTARVLMVKPGGFLGSYNVAHFIFLSCS